jgi:hypothetical protein
MPGAPAYPVTFIHSETNPTMISHGWSPAETARVVAVAYLSRKLVLSFEPSAVIVVTA